MKPFFSKASNCLVEESGNITIRTIDKDGKEKVEMSHIDLPPDVSNGFTGTMLLNASPNADPFKLSLVALAGEGPFIQLSVDVAGEEPFSLILGVRRKATVFRVHAELGGIAGVIAPVIGKHPKEVFVWTLEGEVPSLVREIGPLGQRKPARASHRPAAKVCDAMDNIPERLSTEHFR